MIVQLILAAGLGSRVGGNKALLRLGGRPILTRLLDAAAEAKVAETIVVVGAEGESVARLCERPRVRVVRNEAYELGQTSSLQAGLRALPAATAAFLIHPVDHCLVDASVLMSLAEAFDAAAARGPRMIARPKFGDGYGHPVLYGASFVREFLALPPDGSARAVYRRRLAEVVAVPQADDSSLFDLDAPADLVEAERRVRVRYGDSTT